MNLPSPIYLLIFEGRPRPIEVRDIETTRETLVTDIASGEIIPPIYIREWFPDEGHETDVTADIAEEVAAFLWLNERGCKGDLRDWIDENCGASEADKINAHAAYEVA